MRYELHKAISLIYFDDACQIKTPQESFTIAGGASVMRTVEGVKGKSREDVLLCLRENMQSETRAIELLGFLEKHDVLVEADKNNFNTQYEAVLDFKNRRAKKLTDGESPLDALAKSRSLSVQGNASLLESFRPMFKTLGLRKKNSDEAELLCFFNYQASTDELLSQNKAAYEADKPYLICNFIGQEFVIGPLVVPGLSTACYYCLYQRSYANAMYKREFLAARKLSTLCLDVPNDICALYVGLVANELRKLRQLDTAVSLIDQALVIDVSDMSFEKRAIVKAPRCEVCAVQNRQPISAIRNMM